MTGVQNPPLNFGENRTVKCRFFRNLNPPADRFLVNIDPGNRDPARAWCWHSGAGLRWSLGMFYDPGLGLRSGLAGHSIQGWVGGLRGRRIIVCRRQWLQPRVLRSVVLLGTPAWSQYKPREVPVACFVLLAFELLPGGWVGLVYFSVRGFKGGFWTPVILRADFWIFGKFSEIFTDRGENFATFMHFL